MANSAASQPTLSHLETICLRVVLGIYAAVVILAACYWRNTISGFVEITSSWYRLVGTAVRLGELPTLDMRLVVTGGLTGVVAGSFVLAEQLVSHTFAFGWRLSGEWIWRLCAFHALLVLALLAVVIVMADSPPPEDVVIRALLPIAAIALTKLTCAILVLREKRPPSDGE
jgi:hypothetical protein